MGISLEIITLPIAAVIAVISFRLGYLMLRADKGSYDVNRERSGTFMDVLFGHVKTKKGDFRDFRVQAGVAFNKKSNKWVEQGVLSDEAIDELFTSDKIKN